MILSIAERDRMVEGLSIQQREYLDQHLIRGRRTVFANCMASQKGYHIPDDTDPEEIELLLQEWVYTGYIDAGKVTSDLRCECGRPLRYQHHVEHKTTGEVLKFGIEHLKEHLEIDSSVVASIKKGFDAIDYELDELLLKLQKNWQPDPDLLKIDEMPEDILSHLKIGLPLLDRQVRRLKQMRLRTQLQVVSREEPPRPQPTIQQFSLFDIPSAGEEIEHELQEYLKAPIQDYIQNGVRSARVICELLIEEHGAYSKRFITGKPHIYFSVCQYIEKMLSLQVSSMIGMEDRYYN